MSGVVEICAVSYTEIGYFNFLKVLHMPITVTPTLSSKTGYVEDIRDQIATLVRFIILNPGSTSELWEDKMISFRVLSSKYEELRQGFANKLGGIIENHLNHMFTDHMFSCEFTTSDYKENVSDGRYTITFSIMIAGNSSKGQYIPALLSGAINVNPDTNEIDLTYNQTLDTYHL